MEEENQFQQITAARKYIAEQALKQQTKKVSLHLGPTYSLKCMLFLSTMSVIVALLGVPCSEAV